jgi:2-C-methyl-D-erythritol 4-phosphate cytidylyltransferase
MADKHIVVVAGGSGKRMDESLPKQFLDLNGKPILFHTLSRLKEAIPEANLVLVMHPDWMGHWQSMAGEFADVPVTQGGVRRFESVARGLKMIDSDEGVIGIHDGVRPLVSVDVIQDCFEAAAEHGAAVPVVPLNESLRKMTGTESHAEDRMNYRIVQTPQCFRADLIKAAYEQSYDDRFTDDATVVEATGQGIHLVSGNTENIKITTPSDLLVAGSLL